MHTELSHLGAIVLHTLLLGGGTASHVFVIPDHKSRAIQGIPVPSVAMFAHKVPIHDAMAGLIFVFRVEPA